MAKSSKITEKILLQKYLEYVLDNGSEPASILIFCNYAGCKTAEFKQYYHDLQALEESITTSILKEMHADLLQQENFLHYQFQEKLLAYFYTAVQALEPLREYYLFKQKKWKMDATQWKAMLQARTSFKEFIEPIFKQAEINAEIPARKFIDKLYADALWLNFGLIVQFWLKDKSKNYERTDAFIEKTVNLSAQLLAQNTLDQILDLGKFMMQKS